MRFYLFDRIVEFEKEKRCVGVKSVSLTEDFFINHYKRKPVMPECLVMESIAQVGGWAVSASAEFAELSILSSVAKFKSHHPVYPGDQLRLEIEITSAGDSGRQISGVVKNGDIVVAEAEGLTYCGYKYDGYSAELEKEFNMYRAGDASFLDNAWYKAV